MAPVWVGERPDGCTRVCSYLQGRRPSNECASDRCFRSRARRHAQQHRFSITRVLRARTSFHLKSGGPRPWDAQACSTASHVGTTSKYNARISIAVRLNLGGRRPHSSPREPRRAHRPPEPKHGEGPPPKPESMLWNQGSWSTPWATAPTKYNWRPPERWRPPRGMRAAAIPRTKWLSSGHDRPE
jgi:hypothetical protein